LWRYSRHDCRHPYVCRYFWHHSGCGDTALQRGTAWNGSVLHDGRHNFVAAVTYHAPQGGKTETVGVVYWCLCDRNYCCWLSVQCISIYSNVIWEVIYNGTVW